MIMKVLLDTNILIHREATTVVRDDIGVFFKWLDKLQYRKFVHPLSVNEIKKHADPVVVRTFEVKIQSYELLRTCAEDTASIATLRDADQTDNDSVDTSLLVIAEVAANRVDALITEDRNIHRKAMSIGLDKSNSVYTIDRFDARWRKRRDIAISISSATS